MTVTINDRIDTPTDNDWYLINATGGFCVNDFGSTYSGAALYDIVTNTHSVVNLAGPFSSGSGFYSDDTQVFIHFHSGGSGVPPYFLTLHL